MSWEDQGRQYHGYFGHGTMAKTFKPGEQEGDRFGPNGLIRRIVAVAASLVAAAPRRDRGWLERVHDAESHARLAYLMNAWIGGDALNQAQFSRLFFDRAPDSKLALNFRLAAHGAEYAKNSADIRAAADRLAAAMQEVGAYHWLKFIRDATEAADAPKTAAEINLARKLANPRLDGIEPTPVPDIVLGGVGTLLRRGAAEAGGVVAGAVLRRLVSGKPAPQVAEPDTITVTPEPELAAPPKPPFKVQQTQAEIDAAIENALKSSDRDTRLEGRVAQDVRNSGFQVTGMKNEIRSDRPLGEIDVETSEAIIEVTKSNGSKIPQLDKLLNNKEINPTEKPVILFAPNYSKFAEKSLRGTDVILVRTKEEIISALKTMKEKK